MLVIQDDVKDGGEGVCAAGLVPHPHSHTTAKTADCVTVRMFCRNVLLLGLFPPF